MARAAAPPYFSFVSDRALTSETSNCPPSSLSDTFVLAMHAISWSVTDRRSTIHMYQQ